MKRIVVIIIIIIIIIMIVKARNHVTKKSIDVKLILSSISIPYWNISSVKSPYSPRSMCAESIQFESPYTTIRPEELSLC